MAADASGNLFAPDCVKTFIPDYQNMLKLSRQTVGPWSVNAYALICPATGISVLIDPGAEPDSLQKMLADSQPAAILITHCHPDHVGALTPMRQLFNVPVMAHPGASQHASPVGADRWLQDGDEVSVGHHQMRVFYSPGHTDDQICFAVQNDNRIIVGDTIFPGGPGKTWSVQDFKQTLITLRDTVLAWPDDTICHPGHGPSFRLGDKRRAIELFLNKDHGAFFGDATWEDL